jgi:hypothetical protein
VIRAAAAIAIIVIGAVAAIVTIVMMDVDAIIAIFTCIAVNIPAPVVPVGRIRPAQVQVRLFS